MGRFTKSKSIDPADYVAFMCDCWWNKPGAGASEKAAE